MIDLSNPKLGDLKVWRIPQMGIKNVFEVPVKTIDEAKLLLTTLANYDLFQLANNVKGDYANAGGLSVYEKDADNPDAFAWYDWYSEEGDTIDDLMRED